MRNTVINKELCSVKKNIFNRAKLFALIFMFGEVLFLGEIYGADTTSVLLESKGEVAIMRTPDGIRFGIWGTEMSYPAPTLFIFAGTIELSLGDSYYRQCGNELAGKGFLCVSLDLPGHGLEKREGEPEGLSAWRFRSDKWEDFVSLFTKNVRNVLDYLVKAGYTDSEHVAACGTSRGGFMALQLTAVEKRIKAIAAFSPVTELMALREFSEATNEDFVESLSLKIKADQFVGKSLWLIIGDRDERVGTDNTIEFARRVTNISLKQSKSADVTLIVQPEPAGHTTPAHSPEKAAEWILEKLR